MTTSTDKERVRRYIEDVWGRGDEPADEALLAPDYVDHTPPPGIAADRTGHRENLRMFRLAFPNARLSIDDLIAEGESIVVRWTMQATQQGPFYGIAATNKPCRLTGIDIYRLANGQIREVWHQQD